MKFRTIFSILIGGCALMASAQGGYQDGVDYYNADRFDKAKTILEKTLNDPATKKAVSYFYLGNLDLRDGNNSAAAANYEKGVQADAQYGYNYVGLGEIALKNGNKNEAERYFKQALDINKKDASMMAAIARAYFNVDPTAYKKEIDKYIENGMKASKNKNADLYILRGDMAKSTGDVGLAAGSYEQAVIYAEESGEVNPEGYVKYSNLYNRVNPDFAINKLVELNEKLPASALAQSELAEKYYDNNMFTRAAEQYGKYMQNPNHFQTDEQRYSGLLYFGKKYNESLDVANQVLAKDPDNEYMHRMVMLNKKELGDFAGAAEAAQKLFAHTNSTFTANDYTTYGDVLAELNKPQEAIEAYEKAYAINNNKDILASISSMYTDLEDYVKAVEYMQKYVDLGDASLNDYFTLSNRYRNLGISLPEGSPERKEAAEQGIKYVDMALESAATKGPLFRNKASLIMIRDGQDPANDDIKNIYDEMIASYDEDPANKQANAGAYRTAYNYIANYYLAKNDKDKARQYFNLLLEVDPDNAQLREFLSKF